MRRGPKTKPTNLKIVKGTMRKGRENTEEPVVAPSLPTPPSHLCAEAVEEWDRVAQELVNMGVLTQIDRAALSAYCQSYGRWVRSEKALARFADRDKATFGIMMKTQAGNAIQNPLVGAANKAMADMVRYAAEFGLTPSSRAGVKGVGDDKNKDPTARFFS